jgi:succinoglycan biosynthesis transport protein ExoP
MNITNLALPPSAKAESSPGSDLHRLIATFRRRSSIFTAVAVVIIAGVVLVTFQQTPRYAATANVMIDTRKHVVDNIQEVLSGLPSDSSAIDTEVEILRSRSLAEQVVTALKLDKDPEFNSKLSPVNPIIAAITAPFSSDDSAGSQGSDSAAQPASDIHAIRNHEAVVDHVLRRLSIRRSGLTYVINVTFESQDRAKAALIANTFADKYLLEQLVAKVDATQQATQWLNGQLAQLEPQVRQAEAAVEQYKAQHGLLASVGSSLTEQEISNLNNQLAQAQADQAEHDARLRTAQQAMAAGSTGEELAGALNSETVKELRSQKATISSKVADMQTKYGPRFPEVQRVQRQLTDIDAQISQEVGRQVSNLQAEDQVAHQRTASIQASLAGAKGTLVGNNQASVELTDLQRKADAASTLYNNLLNRAKQTSTDQSNQQSDSRVVSRAKIPDKPSYPNKGLNLALGLVFGLAGGVGGIVLMEALDGGLSTAEDVERYFGLPCLGSIPELDSTTNGKPSGISPERFVVEKPLSAFAESFRNLRTSILFSKIDTSVKVAVITSALPGEGKTTTTFCLGRSIAMAGSKVVVVDCDLRRRNVNRLLKIEPTAGLVEILQGSAELSDVLVLDEASGAYFLPLSRSAYTPKDLFGSAAMDRLLADLRARFDLVLLDTAPILPVADTRILAPKADVVVFLAEWRKTPRKAVEAAFTMLSSVGANVAGIALTAVDMRQQARFGYGDPGYYYRSYRKYYAQ